MKQEAFFGRPIPHPQAVALFSRGLDSILAVKILQRQGIAVQGILFMTPFFNAGIRERENDFITAVNRDYDIPLCVVDISEEFLELLQAPAHGYGKNFNPCIDCKLLMVRKARDYAAQWGAAFIVTGEVLGQRPFSQRRDTMRIIERDSGTTGILLRPLSARLLPETIPEQEGLVKREELFDFSGRGRKPQMELAARLGISSFPSPAGGCLLTDPAYARRLKTIYADCRDSHHPALREVEMLKYGRFYHLPPASFLIVGRKQAENKRLLQLAGDEDVIMRLAAMPGPIGILCGTEDKMKTAAARVVQHSKGKNLDEVLISWSRGSRSGTFKHVRSKDS